MRRVTLLLSAAGLVLLLLLLAGWEIGRFLVVNDPQPADVILVVAGEWNARPLGGLDLLRRGYAPRMILSTDSTLVYDRPIADIAAAWAASQPEAARISVCANAVFSTRAEAIADRRCLGPNVRRVLLVTSNYHTRRALMIFAHEIPRVHFSVAAVNDTPDSDIRHWWRHREDAKNVFFETTKLAWWELIDRWRPGH